MSINNKIIEYLEYKGVSQRRFTKMCKFSEGILRRGRSINATYFKVIKTNYPDLNFDWLLFDEGNMILDDNYNLEKIQNSIINEPNSSYNVVKFNCKEKINILQQSLIEAQNTIIELQKELNILQKKNQLIKKINKFNYN